MKQYHDLAEVENKKRILVLGHFDGIHLGHQALLEAGRRMADEKNMSLMVFTFYPQFQSLRDPDFKYILQQNDKMALLDEFGVDECLTIPFNNEIAGSTPESFVQDYLLGKLNAEGIVVGFDYTFGHKAAGKAENLPELTTVPVRIVEPFTFGDQVISSTAIRNAIRQGRIRQAECVLGYDYALTGKVVHGLANGRRFLVPTANIALAKDILLPKAGVYVATCRIIGEVDKVYQAVVNIGTRPTIDDNPAEIVEAHILDFDRDIYGETIRLSHFHYLRGIVKYKGMDDLLEAIMNDIQDARKYFDLNHLSS